MNWVPALAATLLICLPLAGLSDGTILTRDSDLRLALKRLQQVSAGARLIRRALDFWELDQPEQLVNVFRWGEVSKTDSVLTRHFDPKTGREYREREVTIYIKRGQRFAELVLDVAHELVHATQRPAWDPYDPKLTAATYIQSTIEGPGGEIDAVLVECEVGRQLAALRHDPGARCKEFPDENGDRSEVRADFYRVGRWSRELESGLGAEAPLLAQLSGKAPKLLSSTGRAPYPVALLREYEQLTEVACENSRKRLAVVNARRAPAASERSGELKRGILDFIKKRCPPVSEPEQKPERSAKIQYAR